MQFITLLKVGRISNLPTVWSNILAALVIASFYNNNEISWDISFILVFSLSFIYIAGMFLNDAFDASWDKKHNNLRPIVLKEIEEKSVWILGVLLLILAIGIISIIQDYYVFFSTLGLIVFILIYNAFHKKYNWTFFLMGASRASIYLITFLSLGEPSFELFIFMFGLFFYVTGVTYLAKDEHNNVFSNRFAILFLFSPSICLLLISNSFLNYISAFIFLIWVSIISFKYFKNSINIKKGIGVLLGTIPLIDALFLLSINAILPALVSFGIFLLIPYLYKYISGT